MEGPHELGPLAQPTRARLFTVLGDLGRAASTEELAKALGMHVNGIRRHLELMRGAGLLERERIPQGRGRPRDAWSVAPGAAPDEEPPEDYADVARWLARAMPSDPAGLRRVERTGREIGRELAVGEQDSIATGIQRAFTALGFQPATSVGAGGQVGCVLTNCPYRASARENPDVVCTLHRGITRGLLDQLDPRARLARFEPRDPDLAGCVVEVIPSRDG